MNQGHLKNISHISVDGYLMIGNGTRDKNRTMISVRVKYRKLICAYKEDSPLNPSTCVCGCDKNSEIDEFLKDMESLDIPGKSC